MRPKKPYPRNRTTATAVADIEFESIKREAAAHNMSISDLIHYWMRRGGLVSAVEKNFPDDAPILAHNYPEIE